MRNINVIPNGMKRAFSVWNDYHKHTWRWEIDERNLKTMNSTHSHPKSIENLRKKQQLSQHPICCQNIRSDVKTSEVATLHAATVVRRRREAANICASMKTFHCYDIVRQFYPADMASLAWPTSRVGNSVATWYIHTKFQKFGIFSKCMVYNTLIWYIWKISYIFDIFLSKGLVDILNQFICFITKRIQINRLWCWSYIKKLSDLA